MRLHTHSRILATAATVAALAPAVPAAHASLIGEGGDGASRSAVTAQPTSAPRHHSNSIDWETVAIAGGGTVVLVGVCLAGSRRHTRRRDAAGAVRAPHVA